jgi:23S rRNA U2552 (ribose-2'-O)-methylase RlmE/FtsJ
MLTIRLISILNSFFNEVHIYKPLTSSQASSEKFVIGKGFKSNKNNINSLNKLFEDIEKESFIVDINNFEIDENILKVITQVNQVVSDLQYKKINQMYSFLQKKNFFGVEYHEQVKKQVECSSKWLAKYVQN